MRGHPAQGPRRPPGLTRRLAASLTDRRQPGKVQHELVELVRQRSTESPAATKTATTPPGCRGSNPQAPARARPADRSGAASQPTLSRFENAVGCQRCMCERRPRGSVIEHHRARLRGRPDASRSTSIRPTTPPTAAGVHVLQRPLRHLVLPPPGGDADLQRRADPVSGAAVLRPGNSPAKRGDRHPDAPVSAAARGLSPARLRIRLDGALPAPRCWTSWTPRASSTSCHANARLVKRSRRLMGGSDAVEGQWQTEHLYGETRYAARKWRRKRRVIMKAEVVRHPAAPRRTIRAL